MASLRNTPKETMINNTSTNGDKESPTKWYWISTYVLGFIATFLLYHFINDNKLKFEIIFSFILHNVIYYPSIYKRKTA
jgi:hypothetical protein